jgi:glycosyltransferase involved in cell wall biosynthesis
VRIGLDATYSLGKNLSGVGIYSREILWGIAGSHPGVQFHFYYRPHRLRASFSENLPANARRRLLYGRPPVDLFHALNQRVDRPARRTVSTFHDLFVMTGEYSSPEFRARFTEQARRAAALSDAVIAVSSFTASHVEQLLGVERPRIHVVPHGVRLPGPARASGDAYGRFSAREASPPSEAVPARENRVLFVGVIQRRKNIARLVKAFERMPSGWRLALAGATSGFGAAEELRAVEESSRREDVEVLGHQSADQLESLYRRARIFAFPSLDEGFGMPILEAMAFGIPVITSRASAMPEVAGDAALLVDPLSVDEIGDALARLAQDEHLQACLIERGLARARQFTWKAAVEKTWQVYELLLR